MKRLFLTILILLIHASVSYSCFGPELFVAYEKNNQSSYNLANLLDIYIREKTGINVSLKEITKDNLPSLIKKEAVDIIVFDAPSENTTVFKFGSEKKIIIRYRTKIEEDLRFKSLIEALTKLSNLISNKDLNELSILIEKKGKIKRTIKEFLIEKALW